MAKKAADADGGSRATKSSVHWMVGSDILDAKGTRLAVVPSIISYSYVLSVFHWVWDCESGKD